jgi:nickel-dependent lactate racemase
MRIAMEFGRERMEVEVDPARLVRERPTVPPPLADPVAAVRAALDEPFHYPPLRRALTPDDLIAVVVDEHLPDVGRLLTPVLEHVTRAGVSPEHITLVCPPGASRQAWLEDLPEKLEEVRLEVHDPANRKRLAYLATTRHGKRLYLNRTLVEADQVVVLTGRRYDVLLGRGGAEGLLYPGLADAETRAEMNGRVNLVAPDDTQWPTHRDAIETTWLLGAPFFVQVIEAAADGVASVVAGVREASEEAERLLDARWRQTAPPARLVVAGLSGDPARQTFADLAAAAACAARVVEADGRIVLLSRVGVGPGAGGDVLRGTDDPEQALAALRKQQSVETAPALQWADAARRARVSLLSGLDDETAEGLFATPLRDAAQVQRLLDAAPTCLFLDDAHKALAIPESGPSRET